MKNKLTIPSDLYSVVSSCDDTYTPWQETDVNSWLLNPDISVWARNWLESLRKHYQESFPQLLEKAVKRSISPPEWMKKETDCATWTINFLKDKELAQIWFKEGFLCEDPEWLIKLIRYEKSKIARSFLLNGNISDYSFDPVYGFRPTINLLIDTLKKHKDCVLSYRLSTGLSLHTKDEEEIRDKLPPFIQKELDSCGFPNHSSLLTEVCRLFDMLSVWLMGSVETEDSTKNIYNFRKGVAIIFENVHLLIPPNNDDIERNFLVDSLLHWSSSPKLFDSSHCLILMAESLEDVGVELRSRGGKIEQITLHRPETSSARLKFILPALSPSSNMLETRVGHLSHGIDLEGYTEDSYHDKLRKLSNDTAGLTFIGIEDLIQEAAISADYRLNRETVMNLKRERLRQESEGLLEIVDPKRKIDSIGGYSALKNRLKEIVNALEHSHDPLMRSTVPMGVLFLGPPGTGKSIVAEALASEAKNFSMTKLGNFRGMYVGQSERNLSRIFSLIKSLHPVIVFVDEIDQALGSRNQTSGDGGVDSRIFGKFLEFMSNAEHRGKILWIGASNFPNKIDPAMKRAGRFDLILPFLLPQTDERAEIIRVILDSKIKEIENLKHTLTIEDFNELATLAENFSGAELEAIVGEVLRRIAQKKISVKTDIQITKQLFQEVFKIYQPPPEQRKHYKKMEVLAIQEVSFIDLLPERYQTLRLQV